MNHSIISFNLSVSDKHNVSKISDPFQIMPATQNHISDKTLSTYDPGNNPRIILHMNYITHVFSDKAVMNDSTVRYSIRQYTKLADILGTKNILIHMPYTLTEWNNLAAGMNVIKDEICDRGYVVHLEIPSWARDLLSELKSGDPVDYISEYLDTVFEYCREFPYGSYKLVPDTAHMWADGCTEVRHFEQILTKYSKLIEYIHLNGNLYPPFRMDSHAPIFDDHSNKIKCWKDVCQICSKLKVICIAEITKNGLSWDEWEQYADEYGFDLVEPNYKYTI